MRLSPHELIQSFAQAPFGTRLWLPGLGRSMAPLLNSGDAVEVERCDEAGLRPGDVALLLRGKALVAHVVNRSSPVETMNLRGVVDPPGAVLLGRVVTLRRGARLVRVNPAVRLAVLGMVRLARSARATPVLRRLGMAVRSGVYGPSTSALRERWLGEIRVQALGPQDLAQTLRFCGDHLDLDAFFLSRQLTQRWSTGQHAFGAFGRDARMVGFGFVDAYREEGVDLDGEWLRFQFVAPVARGLGVARRLVLAQVAAAAQRGVLRVYADVRADNLASLRLFQRLGFTHAPGLSERVCEVRRAAEGTFTALTLDLRGTSWRRQDQAAG